MAHMSRGLPSFTGQEGCRECGKAPTRFYGEEVWLDTFLGFTGWRGPYCSLPCYRQDHDDANYLRDLARFKGEKERISAVLKQYDKES